MNMDQLQLKKSQISHLEDVYAIMQDAKLFQKQNNIRQWTEEKPSFEDIKKDIENQQSFVLQNNENDEIIACAAVIIGEDSTYLSIYEGNWHTSSNGEEYAAIHRFALSKKYAGKGFSEIFMEKIFGYLRELRIYNVRIDTHKDNVFMQKLIKKSGFQYCGIIHIADGSLRLAYDRHL